jgi:type VI secretion system protein ImpL
MLSAGGRSNPDIVFNRQYPGSAQVVIEPHSIPAAFTRAGFSIVQDALANPEKYYGAEEWVLGGASSIDIPKEKLQEDLRNRYASEYLNHWRSFIRDAAVVHYGSLGDAANKLRILSGNRSPLMQLFWVAAINTNVDLPGSAKAFDAVQRVSGGATEDHPIGTGAQPYMMALNSLQGAIASAAGTAHSADTSGPINSALVAAGSARSSVGQIAQEFLIDNENHLDSQVRKLMDDPIVSAEALVRRAIQENEKQQALQQQANSTKQ